MIKELQPPTAIVQNNNDFSTQPSSIQPAVVPPNIPSSHDDWSHEGHSRPQKPKREFKPTRQPPVPPPRSSTTTKSQNSPLPISESTSTKDLTNTLNQFFGQEIEKSSTITYSLFDIESPEDVARMDVQQLLGHLREHGIEATEDTERSILVAQVTSLWTRKEIQGKRQELTP